MDRKGGGGGSIMYREGGGGGSIMYREGGRGGSQQKADQLDTYRIKIISC